MSGSKAAADLVRIGKGLNLVVDHLVSRSKPEVVARVKRAQFHLTELFKLAIEFRPDTSASGPPATEYTSPPASSSQQHTQEGYQDIHTRDVEPSHHPVSVPVPIPVHVVPAKSPQLKNEDLIGFPFVPDSSPPPSDYQYDRDMDRSAMKERMVPSSPMARLWGFGSLATRMAVSAATDSASRFITGTEATAGGRISDENAERLAEALCRYVIFYFTACALD
jgi:aarF domain-containing kinase